MAKLFVEQISVIDSSILIKERGVVGESWIVDLELEGELDGAGMLFDFGLVKKRIKTILDDIVDHKLIVPINADFVMYMQKDERTNVIAKVPRGEISVSAPNQAFCMLDSERITVNDLSKYAELMIKSQLPDNISTVRINLRNETVDGCYCQYSHGLKKHEGNCQRIAHGHRSPIKIFLDGNRHAAFEKEWSNKLQDIYIGKIEDIISEEIINGIEMVRFGYTSEQGDFSICLPAEECFFMEDDATVENIAAYIHADLEKKCTGKIQVILYEGVGKGAIV